MVLFMLQIHHVGGMGSADEYVPGQHGWYHPSHPASATTLAGWWGTVISLPGFILIEIKIWPSRFWLGNIDLHDFDSDNFDLHDFDSDRFDLYEFDTFCWCILILIFRKRFWENCNLFMSEALHPTRLNPTVLTSARPPPLYNWPKYKTVQDWIWSLQYFIIEDWLRFQVNGHKEDIMSIAQCAPNLLATSSYDGEVLVWNLISGHVFCRLHAPPIDGQENGQMGESSWFKVAISGK